jgi:hypothetical protein
MDIAGSNTSNPKPLPEPGQPTITTPIPPPIRPLQLNTKPLPTKDSKKTPGDLLSISSGSSLKRPGKHPIPGTT